MHIAEYISIDYQTVTLNENVEDILNIMKDNAIKQLVVVDQNIYKGSIHFDDLINIDKNQSLEEKDINQIHLYDNQHIYDALQLISSVNISFIPILDIKNNFCGILTKQDILNALNSILGSQDAAIIVLEIAHNDNNLSHIARLIEEENNIIYSISTHKIPHSEKIALTITTDKANFSAVLASLKRNNYIIMSTFRNDIDYSSLNNRYELLMNYLDM